MSSEIRTFVRQLEKWSETDNVDIAISEGTKSIRSFDAQANYYGSYLVASKLADLLESKEQTNLASKFRGIALIRSIFLDDPLEAKKALTKADKETAIANFAQALQEGKGDDSKRHYFLLDLEFQTLWGDFKKIRPLPLIDFEGESEAKIILEDYFPWGIYHLHMIERGTQRQRRIDIPVGQVESLDVIEKVTTLIIPLQK